MSPSVWIGFILVVLMLLAGGAEIYAQRRRRGELRERFKLEYSGASRNDERLRRAEAAFAARQQCAALRDTFAARRAPVAIPVMANNDARHMNQRQAVVARYISLEAD